MFRYIALLWSPADATQDEAARVAVRRIPTSPEWRCSLDGSGIKVFHTAEDCGSDQAHLLDGGSGVVLGTIFERQASGGIPRTPMLAVDETADILASSGRVLVERYWGRYVAFLQDVRTGTRWILRDPTGRLPCLTMRFRGVAICFSFMDDAARLGLLRFSFNWPYLTAQMIASLLETRETALNEVTKVLAGECLEFEHDAVSRSFYWHPFRIAAAGLIEERQRTAGMLRETVSTCVHAWASRYDRILHRLSGGLDSSIVLGCMRTAPVRPKITCLNYYSEGSDSDEREYARIAARHAEVRLVELERNPRCDLRAMLSMPHLAEPRFFAPLQLERRESEIRVARENRAGAVFDGNGGDGIFYQSPLLPTVADYARIHGLRPAIFGIALHVARMEETTIWRVLASALRHKLRDVHWNAFAEAGLSLRLLNPAALSPIDPERLMHPWLRDRAGMPPGKLWHILNMSIPLNIEDPMAEPDDPDEVEPLISQPVFELCLRIPTYVLAAGGWDRAIAREAFVTDVPTAILKRRTKGGIEDHVHAILKHNISFVREMLLDGVLVKEQLIDREKVEEVLSGDPSTVAAGSVELLTHLSTETWLRTWSAARQKPAA